MCSRIWKGDMPTFGSLAEFPDQNPSSNQDIYDINKEEAHEALLLYLFAFPTNSD